jgi:hypothetical protein
VYVSPVPAVVVAELNFEKSEADRHPDVPELAVAHVSTEASVPMTEIGCDIDSAPEAVSVVVPTFANVLTPEKYAMLPTTAGVDVERPPNVTVLTDRFSGKLNVNGASYVHVKIDVLSAVCELCLLDFTVVRLLEGFCCRLSES